MKKNELLSALRSLQNNKNRTALAVTVGVMAMLLLLLSELLPSGNTQKTAASTVRTAAVSQYQTQLEQQLEELISQLQGAGRTTVMVTLTTGEETIYAVDTQTGDLQQQELRPPHNDKLGGLVPLNCCCTTCNCLRRSGNAAAAEPSKYPGMHPRKCGKAVAVGGFTKRSKKTSVWVLTKLRLGGIVSLALRGTEC